MRFVIADDSPRPRDFLFRVLRDAGYEVIRAVADGREAVDACAELCPDFVILDVSMKRMGGVEAANLINEQNIKKVASGISPTRIIVASSLAQGSVARPLIEMGATFISKPYNSEQFLRRLKEAYPDAAVPGNGTGNSLPSVGRYVNHAGSN